MNKSCKRLLVFLTGVVLLNTHSTSFGEIRAIAPGITHERIIKNLPHYISLHEVIIDPKQVRIEIAQAQEQDFKAQKTSELAKNKKALIAVNGSFFNFGTGNLLKDAFTKAGDSLGVVHDYKAYPVFCLKIKDNWFSLSHKLAGVIAWSSTGETVMDTLKITWRLKVGGLFYPISQINKPRAEGPILYTSAFGPKTPGKRESTEVVIENGVITAVNQNHGHTQIPVGGYVYVVSKKTKKVLDMSKCKIGAKAEIKKKYESPSKTDWETFDFILGSTPLLLKDSVIQEPVLKNKSGFFTKQYARSAIGLFPDGRWLFVVVEARQKKQDGMTLLELADYFLRRGCTSAINLDGGGSSTLVIHDTLINRVSGREWGLRVGTPGEIAVANAIVIFER